jgi:thiol-disulfide isomerase/thioredoxin
MGPIARVGCLLLTGSSLVGAQEAKPVSASSPAAASLPDLPELARARLLVQVELYDEAISLLKKADKNTGGKRADVALDLAVAYYRSRAFKDAEAAARRTLDLTEDATILASPRCAMEPCLPALSLVTSDGQRLTPEELRGNVVVFSFWATWCKPCVNAVPDLKGLHGSYAREPFVMVGINADNDAAVADAFVAKHRMGWAQVTGEHALRVMTALSVHAFPTEMVFDHEGVLVGRTTGWGSQASLTLVSRIGHPLESAKKAREK